MTHYQVIVWLCITKPMFSESLISTVLIRSFHETFSSNITPKSLIKVYLFKMLLTIFKSG